MRPSALALVLIVSCAKIEPPQSRLFTAAARGDAQGVRDALALGASLTALNDQMRTPLHVAAETGRVAIIHMLLDLRPEVDVPAGGYASTPLMLAAYAGHEGAVKALLERGAKIDAENEAGRTPLGLAAQGGQKKVVELLLAAGAKVDQRNRTGETALLQAAEDDLSGAAVDVLLKAGADPNAKDAEGKTALQRARASDNAAAVELLLEAGAKN